MLFNDIKSITIPEGIVSKILCNGIAIWKKAEEPSPEPTVDPETDVMSFGEETIIEEDSGVVEFETTPSVNDEGVLVFDDLLLLGEI